MKEKTLLILCFLTEPTLPAASVKGTGGYNKCIQESIEILKQCKIKTIIITNTSYFEKSKSTIINDFIEIKRVDVPNEYMNNQNLFIYNYKKILKGCLEIIKDIQDQIYLIHSFYWLSGQLATSLSKHLNIPFIHTTVSLSIGKIITNHRPKCNIQFQLEKYIFQNAKYILAITDSERKHIEKYYLSYNKIIVVGRNSSDTFSHPYKDNFGYKLNSYAEHELLVNQFSGIKEYSWWNKGAFLYVGRIDYIKGLDIIITSWLNLYKKYQDLMPPLWIVGSSPLTIFKFRESFGEDLKNNLKTAENNLKIIWWGYLSEESIVSLYTKSLVLITHSQSEAGGRVIIEALSWGLPVISTYTGFGIDLIKNWINGFLVEYNNQKLLMHRMEEFIKLPILGKYMGTNAKITYDLIANKWNNTDKIKSFYTQKFGLKLITNQKIRIDKNQIYSFPFFNPFIKEELSSYLLKRNIDISSAIIKENQAYYKNLITKKFITKINMYKFIDPSLSDVIHYQDMTEKAIESSKFKHVLSITDYDLFKGIVTMPKIEMFPFQKCLIIYTEIFKLVDKFNQHLYDCSDYIIENRINNILNNLNNLNYLHDIKTKLFNNLYKLDLQYVYCYQKNFLNNIGILNNNLYFLPSYTGYIGYLGENEANVVVNLANYSPSIFALLNKKNLNFNILFFEILLILEKIILDYEIKMRYDYKYIYIINYLKSFL